MRDRPITREVKYEAELQPRFGQRIASIPGNEKLSSCIQCGTCSGTCPLSIYMDYTPRRIIAMTRAGFKDEVLSSFTIWLCASCYACTVECPKEIGITDIMYALKRYAIQEGACRKRFPISVLAREFFGAVLKYGRSPEGRVLLRLYLKSNPFQMLRNSRLGLRLLMRGRFGLGADSIRQKDQLRTLMRTIDYNNGNGRSVSTEGRPV
ncbi:MAG TPA: 4Fe-4S dicluster domain-containing protein [Acidobacteriota bacterium]|nr:4Fe-4S dicluster domain-containing protein [Acidobacteriota bacterium]